MRRSGLVRVGAVEPLEPFVVRVGFTDGTTREIDLPEGSEVPEVRRGGHVSKRERSADIRVLIGSGHPSGDKDARDAGPIPKSAGVKVVSKAQVEIARSKASAKPKA